ncbi:hypothetical protein HBE99_04345 [Mycobacteroides chelonae]|uniref:hypothetical protein n=1 Tax=Mycobacteroides chelonae TaxID=1774 RepID=UPI0019106057|nr:hypothetical protein [Mycobacteroides chelonae]QQG96179.1 hypothetical protein HBE99_04345 [Mycobacteroides chelonae]
MSPEEAEAQTVIDMNATIDILKLEAAFKVARERLPEHMRDQQLWRLEPCDFEIYREIQAKTKINPRGLTWPGLAFVWDTPEDEEAAA